MFWSVPSLFLKQAKVSRSTSTAYRVPKLNDQPYLDSFAFCTLEAMQKSIGSGVSGIPRRHCSGVNAQPLLHDSHSTPPSHVLHIPLHMLTGAQA